MDRLDFLNLTKITCIYKPVLSWDNSNIRLVVVSIATKIDLLITNYPMSGNLFRNQTYNILVN